MALGGAVTARFAGVDQHFQARQQTYADDDVLESPGPDALRMATIEHPLAWSDLVWLALVQELARPLEGGTLSWSRVFRWAHIATDLDPKYMVIYHAGAIYLSVYSNKVDESDSLAQKGWKHLPEAWQLPFLLGYNAYFVRGDPVPASEWFIEASKVPGSPHYLPALAGRVRYHSGDHSGAIALLEVMIPQLEGPARTDAESRLAMLKSEQLLAHFDKGCERFLAETGSYPKDGAELAKRGYVRAAPEDLLGNPIMFDADSCTAITEVIKVREGVAQRRVGSRKDGFLASRKTEVGTSSTSTRSGD